MTASFEIFTKRAWIEEVSATLKENPETGELLRLVKVKLAIGLTEDVMSGAGIELKADSNGEWKHRTKRPDLTSAAVRIGDLFFADAKPIGKSLAIQGGVMGFTFKVKASVADAQALLDMMDGEQTVTIASLQEALPGLDGSGLGADGSVTIEGAGQSVTLKAGDFDRALRAVGGGR